MNSNDCNCLGKCSCGDKRKEYLSDTVSFINTYRAGDINELSKRVRTVRKTKKSSSSSSSLLTQLAMDIIRDMMDKPILKDLLVNPNAIIDLDTVKRYIQSYSFKNHDKRVLSDSELGSVVKYVTERFSRMYQERCIGVLPILKFADISRHDKLLAGFDKDNYMNIIMKSIAQSEGYNSIIYNRKDELDILQAPEIKVCQEMPSNLLAVVLAMFLPKLPILEHLVVFSDTYELNCLLSKFYHQKSKADMNDFSLLEYNSDLLKLRLGDPNNFSQSPDSLKSSEEKRMEAHCLLRTAIMDIRNNDFASKSIKKLDKIFKSINNKYVGYTSTPKGMIEQIMKMVSLKPTVVFRTDMLNGGVKKENVYMYSYKFNAPNGVVVIDSNTLRMQQNLLMARMDPMKNLLSQTMHYPTPIPCSTIFSQAIPEEVSLLSSNGLLVIDIDRFNKASFPFRNMEYNNLPISFEHKLNLNSKTFNLTSAIAYKPVKTGCRYAVRKSYKICTLVKVSDDKWFKFSPDMFSESDVADIRRNNLISYMNHINQLLGQEDVITDLSPEIIKSFIQNKDVDMVDRLMTVYNKPVSSISVDQCIISDLEAEQIITTMGIFLFYASEHKYPQQCIPRDCGPQVLT